MASPSLSSDEGEIIEATSLPQPREGGDVDRNTRHPGRHSRTPEYTGPAKHGGNGRPRNNDSPRGHKRPRDDRDSYNSDRGRDPRRFKVHYEGEAPRGGRSSYQDHDRPPSRGSYQHEDADKPASRPSDKRFGGRDALPSRPSNYRQDDRNRQNDFGREHDGYPDKRQRNRSRSPRGGRFDRGKRDRGRFGRDQRVDQAESIKYSAHTERQMPGDSASKQPTPTSASDTQRHDAKHDQGASRDRAVDQNGTSRNSGAQPEQSSAELDFDDVSPADKEAAIEAEIARRRRLREEALKRAIGANSSDLPSASASEKASESTPVSTRANTPHITEANTPRSGIHSPAASGAHDPSLSPAALNIANDQDLINTHVEAKVMDEDGPSAADYDPTADMKEDERRDEMRHGHVGLHGQDRHPSQAEIAVPEPKEPSKEQTDQDDDDEFDMFADDFDEEKFPPPKAETKAATTTENRGEVAELAQPAGGGILEGDDKDGYYKIRPGEILGGRYQIQSALGKGMFSGVARAMDITTKEVVAIKLMRNNDALRKGGFTEIAILEKLNAADPDNKKHIVKFESWFEYRGHLCMVFENLSLNLREVLKKFGNNIGININATRAYAYQIFVALAHMRKCSIIHADLKPDNILVNETRNVLKICDLGTAIDRSDAATAHNDVTPYLVSRFYRAPEIILGMPYDYSVDMWSIGCTLYELYTGKILFTGDSNNQMLRNIMEVRGKISGKLYRRGQLSSIHFDDMGNFVSIERDKLGKVRFEPIFFVVFCISGCFWRCVGRRSIPPGISNYILALWFALLFGNCGW
ncbi:kinase-like domain-containing protein [Coniochaeta sp. 2T2.1]|nr:kinase-like domain-containing protein [Coniochaeta sp. 2T2.1]